MDDPNGPGKEVMLNSQALALPVKPTGLAVLLKALKSAAVGPLSLNDIVTAEVVEPGSDTAIVPVRRMGLEHCVNIRCHHDVE
ncbi:MAG: hypothetical protein ACK4HF_15930 [Paracoccaceae bacterium]